MIADVLVRDGPPFCVHIATISISVSIVSLISISTLAIQSISMYVPVISTASLGYATTDTALGIGATI